MPTLNEIYWENRYKQGETGWDTGNASPALINYAAQIQDKSLSILIPGCGNAHEAEALLNMGFLNITLLDIAMSPLENAKQKLLPFVESGKLKLVHEDFFAHKQSYDLILEQTFFCAIHPQMRADYAVHMHAKLNTHGTLAGLLFDFPLSQEGPPFGGGKEEYIQYFNPFFTIHTLEKCHNSIKPRDGRELFFILKKKNA